MRNRRKNFTNRFRENFSSSTLDSRDIRQSISSSNELSQNKPSNSQNQQLGSVNEQLDDKQIQYNTMSPFRGDDVRNLPRHLFRPFNAQSVDIRNLQQIPPNDTSRVLEFVCPNAGSVIFIGYGVFSDAFLENDIEFVPKVNGKRIFTYHGNPGQNYRISLGLAPDLSNSALIECYLQLRPGDVLTWDIVSTTNVALSAGVRMKGYLDSANLQIEQQFGG